MPRRVVLTADDFGLSEAVNEAVEQGHLEGILGAASLMVAGPAAADAVTRARRLPRLRVGLHLVLVEGPSVLGRAEIPDLVDRDGWFPPDQARLGISYFFRPSLRRQLAREIRAQFAAFAATGLFLEHADAHKHMHLHPTVGRLMIEIGRSFGLAAVRVPREPPAVLGACGERVSLEARALAAWTRLLRRQVRRAGMRAPDHVFGLAWSGGMTAARLAALAPRLPPGLSEIYVHPASRTDPLLARLMPAYRQTEELAALLDPMVARVLSSVAEILPGYGGEPASLGEEPPLSTLPGGPRSTSPVVGPRNTSPAGGGGGAGAGGGLRGTGTKT
ncbi:MAG: hopanoid biosynthesis-associated protein HpnK [Rhodospirillales bacterium]|nr:hopanoid biosynthesis-associated protein HpnK [Rhodospirillales bacterium]